ncbi:hypothetical protein [Antarcticirhabdus aurantiaca]|uniref:Uncharacterized protein n=1 Tax=Antarcticirhabdus aurantiaca TaxID=2606717 RepID=A0ACD4NLB1_9HYPH|nr:hypothetical protein [Antarcticirhabdus aurantiaca]WAJ27542.1 hypothetical protein OXU80_22275 [Jeongeuplla avenae]
MRVSAKKGDPGFAAWEADRERWRHAKIFLDGAAIDHVVTVDTDAGYVLRNKTNEDGQIYCIPGMDEIAEEDLFGTVTIQEPSTE